MIQVAFKGVYLGGHWASGRGGNDLVWFPPLRPNYFPISWQSFYFRFQVVDLNITKPLWQLQALHISCFSINQWMHLFVAGRSCVVLWRRCKIPRTTNYITIRTGGSLMVAIFALMSRPPSNFHLWDHCTHAQCTDSRAGATQKLRKKSESEKISLPDLCSMNIAHSKSIQFSVFRYFKSSWQRSVEVVVGWNGPRAQQAYDTRPLTNIFMDTRPSSIQF